MKTNKISAMLLSAAIACTPVLSSAAQIVASAEESTTATVAETTAAAAEAVAVPVAVDPAAVVVAAETNPETQPTAEAPTQAPTQAPATTATTVATTVENKKGSVSFDKPEVDNNYAAGNAMVKGQAVVENVPEKNLYDEFDLPTAAGIGVALTQGEREVFKNPNFNPFDTIYKFRMPDTTQGKMLYTPNPRWFINTPTPAVVGGSGSTATITWDPVPMADGYRYTIRTYVIDPSADSHKYSFESTTKGFTTGANAPKSVGVNKPADGAKAQDDDPGVTYEIATDAKGETIKDEYGNPVKINKPVDKVMTGDLKGQLTDSAATKMANDTYNVDRYPTKFRVKEDFTTNAKFQEQDATTNYTLKENWKEFTNLDKNLVVGYTYNLDKPSVSVAADVPVRIEIMIQAFRIDNATGELYNMSAVSEPRVVDLNWVAKESWEGMLGAPDQYEDEFFRAAYHKLDVPEAPSSFKITWKYVTMPVRNQDDFTLAKDQIAAKNTNNLDMQEYFNKDQNEGYAIQRGNGIKDPNNSDRTLDTKQVMYVDKTNFTEEFNLKGFDPSKKPAHLDVSDQLKAAKPEQWALNTSINQAIDDDFDRKVQAYNEWKRQIADPITKWNDDHKDQIEKAWRTAYKEAIKAYAASEYSSDKRYSMRYGLLDLDRNGVPELIVSFSSKADKNSYVVIDFQQDRAKLRTVKDANYTEWYYEDVLGACAKRGRCFKLDNLAPIDSWTAADDEKDPLATTTTSGGSSASSSASSSSGSSSGAAASTDGAPKTGDAGVAGLAAVAFASVASMFAACRRKKD